MKYLLITPPLTQLNTPYPATTVLKGYLQIHGMTVDQTDLGIELVNRIYTKTFLEQIFQLDKNKSSTTECHKTHPNDIADSASQYLNCVETVMRFLRGDDNTLAPRIANRSLLPEGPRFNNLADMEWAFGTSGTEDKARYLATLFVQDIADYIRNRIDSHFDLIRYAEQLASFAPTFDELEHALQAPQTLIDKTMLQLLQQHIELSQPDIVGFSIPFPGCLYTSLRCSQWLRKHYPNITIVYGGGFPNTEWRQLSDPRIFNYCHYITLDDGEEPLLRIGQLIAGKISNNQLLRTLHRDAMQLTEKSTDCLDSVVSNDTIPDFEGLPLPQYLSLAEMTNPMHRLWSNGRWNKLMMAHGCYWAKCAFCDTTLDYIGHYNAPPAALVVNRMEHITAQTGNSGFHFVDEALPPKLLRNVGEEILNRGITFSFWGNIRFEKAYTQELCNLLADAGCVAVSGGLEVASNRLLKLMNKGVTIEQTVDACRHFKQAGIMVHTYLMYGFPTETLQETINALEVVRRMFSEGIVQSAFWHRYAMTCHSPSGRNPEQFGVRRTCLVPNPFCNNEVDFEPISASKTTTATAAPQPLPSANAIASSSNMLDSMTSTPLFDYDIDAVGEGLRFATYNYMNEIGLDLPLKRWFSIKVPKPQP